MAASTALKLEAPARGNSTLFLVGGAGGTESAMDFRAQLRGEVLIDDQTEVCLGGITLDWKDAPVVPVAGDITYNLTAPTAGAAAGLSTATVASGVYTPASLASETQRALNAAAPAGSSPFSPFPGSWEVEYLSAEEKMQITYSQATQSKAVEAELILTNMTFATGTTSSGGSKLTKGGAAGAGTALVTKPLPLNMGYHYCTVQGGKDFEVLLQTNNTAYTPATALVRISYDNSTTTFNIWVRGVAQPDEMLLAPLVDSLLVLAKQGDEVVVGYRAEAAPSTDPLNELVRVALLPTDPDLEPSAPRIYAGFSTTEAGTIFEVLTFIRDPTYTLFRTTVNGDLYELDGATLADHDLTAHAILRGTAVVDPDELGASPFPGISSSRRITFTVPAGSPMADILGFPAAQPLVMGATQQVSIKSSFPIIWSFDKTGLQTSVYVTSTALNTGSVYYSAVNRSGNTFIVGSAPATERYASRSSHLEYASTHLWFQTLVVGGKRPLTSIDIQLRDSAMNIIELPLISDARSTVEIFVRNHPTR